MSTAYSRSTEEDDSEREVMGSIYVEQKRSRMEPTRFNTGSEGNELIMIQFN